jgi:hypothetical protein
MSRFKVVSLSGGHSHKPGIQFETVDPIMVE